MATYTYETIPTKAGQKVRRYEIQQPMKDDALTHHPETGEAIRRVITGGLGFIGGGEGEGHGHGGGGGGCCGGGCGCGCH